MAFVFPSGLRAMPDFLSLLASPFPRYVEGVGSSWLLFVSTLGVPPELELGLRGALQPGEITGTSPLAFHTRIATGRADDLPQARIDARALAARLEQGPHFLLPLCKRSSETFSERISVGRARNKDVVLRHGSVSKFHAWFESAKNGALLLGDAGSKNGTLLDGEPLPHRELVEVPEGVPLRFGSISAFVASVGTLWEACR